MGLKMKSDESRVGVSDRRNGKKTGLFERKLKEALLRGWEMIWHKGNNAVCYRGYEKGRHTAKEDEREERQITLSSNQA